MIPEDHDDPCQSLPMNPKKKRERFLIQHRIFCTAKRSSLAGSGAADRKGRRKSKRPAVSRKEVKAMCSVRAEVIICTGLRVHGGR